MLLMMVFSTSRSSVLLVSFIEAVRRYQLFSICENLIKNTQ